MISKLIAKVSGEPYKVMIDGKMFKITVCTFDDHGILTQIKIAKHPDWLHVPIKIGRRFADYGMVVMAPVLAQRKLDAIRYASSLAIGESGYVSRFNEYIFYNKRMGNPDKMLLVSPDVFGENGKDVCLITRTQDGLEWSPEPARQPPPSTSRRRWLR